MPAITLDTAFGDALGAPTAKLFERAFGMSTVADLLTHYPRRYARRGELTPIDSLPLGEQARHLSIRRRIAEDARRSRSSRTGIERHCAGQEQPGPAQ